MQEIAFHHAPIANFGLDPDEHAAGTSRGIATAASSDPLAYPSRWEAPDPPCVWTTAMHDPTASMTRANSTPPGVPNKDTP
jgi:hypothetical protein